MTDEPSYLFLFNFNTIVAECQCVIHFTMHFLSNEVEKSKMFSKSCLLLLITFFALTFFVPGSQTHRLENVSSEADIIHCSIQGRSFTRLNRIFSCCLSTANLPGTRKEDTHMGIFFPIPSSPLRHFLYRNLPICLTLPIKVRI